MQQIVKEQNMSYQEREPVLILCSRRARLVPFAYLPPVNCGGREEGKLS